MLMKWHKLDRKYITLYVELAAASVLYVFPIILADRYYNDDLGRSLYGSLGWTKDGRPLAGILMYLLSGGGRKPIVDISPLPLLVGVFVLSYALILYAREHLNLFSNNQMKVLILLFVITNPLAMSNWSYKYDSIIMLCSVSVPFVIFSIPKVSCNKVFLSGSFAGIVIMSLYQPAIGICLVLFLIDISLYILNRRNELKKDCIRIVGIMSGVLLYIFFIAPVSVDSQGWRHEASQTVCGRGIQAIKIVIDNIAGSCGYIVKYICNTSWIYVGGLCTMIVFLITGLNWKNIKIQHKVHERIYLIISPVIAFVVTFLPLTVLEKVEMRSRIFISFGVFFLYMGFLLVYLMEKSRCRTVRIMIAILLISCVSFHYVFMYTYGDALKCQKEYEKYMVYNIAHDVENLNKTGASPTITFIGEAPRARQVQMMCDKYPFLEEIVPIYFGNSTWLGGVWLYHYLQDGWLIEEAEADDMEIVDAKEPEFANAIYDCYLNGEKIVIHFH